MEQGPRPTSPRPPVEGARPNRLELRPWDDRFGLGYALGFFAFFGATIAAFVAAVRSTSDAGRARSVAAFVAAIGGGFVFAIIYQVVQGIGFGVSASLGSKQALTVLERRRNPFGYWTFVLGGLAVAGTMLAAAAWVWVNADAVAAWMARHPPRGG